MNQDVNLELLIKNVRVVTVKIFAIDLEKQFLEYGREIDENLNLKFLVALEERKEEIGGADPFEERAINIDLYELKGKLGMFIVELEG